MEFQALNESRFALFRAADLPIRRLSFYLGGVLYSFIWINGNTQREEQVLLGDLETGVAIDLSCQSRLRCVGTGPAESATSCSDSRLTDPATFR